MSVWLAENADFAAEFTCDDEDDMVIDAPPCLGELLGRKLGWARYVCVQNHWQLTKVVDAT